MKKAFSFILTALLAAGMSTTAFAADINVTVDGTPVTWTDAKPFIDENSRTLVPLRPIANALGLSVAWDDDKNQASFTDGETTVVFTIGEKEYYVFLNDTPDFNFTFETDAAAVIANSRTYAPARYLAECFQYVVGWNQATQTVLITKETAPDEEIIVGPAIPAIPEGLKYVAEPMVTDAGTTVISTIVLNGMVEDPDIFTYDSVLDAPVESLSHGLMFEDGYIMADFQPEMSTPPGEYTLTWTLPGGWFEDGEDVVVNIPLTVNKVTVASAMSAAFDDLSATTFYVEEGASAEEINAKIEEDFFLFNDTSFVLELSEGELMLDEYGDKTWEFIATVTDTETGETFSCAAKCGLAFDSFDW